MRRLLSGFLIAFAGVVLGLLLLEVAVRAVLRVAAASAVKPDRPPYYYRYAGTQSYANDSFSLQKPSNVFRIVAVGDSFTFPHLMQLDDAYPKRLERMLNLSKAPGLRAEVLNWGVSGLCTVQELPLVQKALTAAPDLVLLQITLNDLQPMNFQDMAPALKERYTFGELEISREKTPLYYYWRTAGVVARRIHNMRTRRSFVKFNLDMLDSKRLWQGFRAAISQMKGACAARGVPFVVLIVPYFHFPLDARYPFGPIHEKFGSYLKKKRIPYLDLLPEFGGMAYERMHVLPGKDSHPNEIAHRVIAERLYDWLEREGLIPKDLKLPERYAPRLHRLIDSEPWRTAS